MNLRSSCVAFVWLMAAIGCDESRTNVEPPSYEVGGGELLRLDSVSDACPTGFDASLVAGSTKFCADSAFAIGDVTRAECAANELDCDALYGCTPTSLSGCDATATTADCGGDGPMTFACADDASGACRWFLGGCVASGFRASLCPADDVCCEANGRGEPLAYPETSPLGAPTSYASWAAGSFTASFGPSPIGLDQGFGLTVSETEPPAATGVSVTCSSAPLLASFFCDGDAVTSVRSDEASWTLSAPNVGSSRIYVELREIGGERVGRVCHTWLTDAVEGFCRETDRFATHCASTGTIELGAERVRVVTGFQGEPWVLEFPR